MRAPRYEPLVTFGNIMQIVAILVQLGVVLAGGIYALSQIDKRVAIIEERVNALTEKVSRIERHVAPPYWGSR